MGEYDPDSRECPACGDTLPFIDGKDMRRYADHLEAHLRRAGRQVKRKCDGCGESVAEHEYDDGSAYCPECHTANVDAAASVSE